MKILNLNDIENKKLLFEKDENNREIFIYNLQDVMSTGLSLIYPNTLLYSNDQLYLPIKEKTMSLQMETIYQKMDMIYNFQKPVIKNIVNESVFFFVYNTDNYFHFLYDSLPNLISYFHLKKDIPDLKLLISYPSIEKNSHYKFVLEFYDLLGLSNELILIDENTLYKNIYITTSYTHDLDSNLPPRKEIYDFFQSFVNITKNKLQIDTPKKIYISRRTWKHNQLENIGTNYTTRRKMLNEDELVDILEKEGYVEVFTENLSTIEKIIYFAQAEKIIGAIGGGISNVLFSKKETKLISLVSPGFLEINKRFCFSLNHLNDVKYFLDCEHENKSEFKLYMRVKEIDTNLIGEIEDIKNDDILISYTDGSNTGWNILNKYNQKWINKNKIIKLDNGLNSPYFVKIDKLRNIINSKKKVCLNYFGQVRNIDAMKYTYEKFIKDDTIEYHILWTTWEDENINKFLEYFPNSFINYIKKPDLSKYDNIRNNYKMDPTNPYKSLDHYLLGLYVKQQSKETLKIYKQNKNINFDIIISLRLYIYLFDNHLSKYYNLNFDDNTIFTPNDLKWNIYNQGSLPDSLFFCNEQTFNKVVDQIDYLENCNVSNHNYFHPETSYGKYIKFLKLKIVECDFQAFPEKYK